MSERLATELGELRAANARNELKFARLEARLERTAHGHAELSRTVDANATTARIISM